MRKRLGLCFASVAVGLAVFLVIRGSEWKQLEKASKHIALAQQASAEDRWADAAFEYKQAEASWPSAKRDSDRYYLLRLATEHARVRSGQIDDALEKITRLTTEVKSRPELGSSLEVEARRELAMTAYYKAWLSRRQGLSSTVWQPLARSARQDFDYLADNSPFVTVDFTNAMHRNSERIRRFEQLDSEAIYAAALPEPGLASNLSLTAETAAKPDPSMQSGQSDGRLRMNFEMKDAGGGGATQSKFKGS